MRGVESFISVGQQCAQQGDQAHSPWMATMRHMTISWCVTRTTPKALRTVDVDSSTHSTLTWMNSP